MRFSLFGKGEKAALPFPEKKGMRPGSGTIRPEKPGIGAIWKGDRHFFLLHASCPYDIMNCTAKKNWHAFSVSAMQPEKLHR